MAAPGSTRTIDVPADLPFVGIRARGRNGAPRLRVAGPGGERFAGGSKGRVVKNGRVLIVPIAREKTTYVFIRRPTPGRWRLTSVGSGNPLTRVNSSRGLAEPAVKASVRPRKRGRTRTLTYVIKRMPGQRVEFTERGVGVARRLGITRRARGKIRFRPRQSSARARKIEALVLQNGMPRASLTVARFKAGPG
jgi:hypothetical protein